jgi:hypothetical protein
VHGRLRPQTALGRICVKPVVALLRGDNEIHQQDAAALAIYATIML